MAGTPRSKRTNDPVGLRNRVLDVAAQSIQMLGYARTAMNDIQKAVPVSAGALYHHFPTKKDLALGVISERVASEIEQTWIQPVRQGPAAADAILGVFRTTIAHLDEAGKVSGCPLGNIALELSHVDEDLRGAIEAQYLRWKQVIAERLQTDRAAGLPGPAADPQAVASLVVSSFSGALSIGKAEQSSQALADCLQVLEHVLHDAAA